MALQKTLVFALFLLCSGYALWALAPTMVRRAIARQLLRLPLPSAIRPVLQRASQSGGGCDCSGCDKVTTIKAPAAAQVVQFYPRKASTK